MINSFYKIVEDPNVLLHQEVKEIWDLDQLVALMKDKAKKRSKNIF
jgi:hypothetical protein